MVPQVFNHLAPYLFLFTMNIEVHIIKSRFQILMRPPTR